MTRIHVEVSLDHHVLRLHHVYLHVDEHLGDGQLRA